MKHAGKTDGKKGLIKRVLVAMAALLALLLVGTAVFMSIPLKPTERAQAALDYPSQTVFMPESAAQGQQVQYGLVLYPGAKVEPQAYTAMMQMLSEKGWLCVLVDAPFMPLC